jgi:L-lactate dehydrogenase (cytochrome)
VTGGKFWFQLYHPRENRLRDDLLDRAEGAGSEVLVALCDVPSFGFRYKDIRNGLAMPPSMSLHNILQIIGCPNWAVNTLKYGKPRFETLIPYFPKDLNIKQLGKAMNETFAGRLNEEKLKPIRDRWKGKLVLKGVASIEDAEMAIRLGLDGLILSNHGGRQLDAGQSSIRTLPAIAQHCKGRIKVMMDSGIRTGPDIARTLASGAEFAFLGRSFMYGVAALGEDGANQVISLLKIQLKQVMEQVCCERVADFPKHLVKLNKS